MTSYLRSGSRARAAVPLIVLFLMLGYVVRGPAAPLASPSADAAPAPGDETLSTFVLASPSELRLAAPPDEARTLQEVDALAAMVAERDEATLQQIAYWASGAPAYRWNQIAMREIVSRGMGANMALRDLALLHVAIYDATVAAWDTKSAYERPRPSEVDPALTTVIPNPPGPSYPSDVAVTAGAASTVLAAVFPDQAQTFEAMAQEAARSRLLAGVEYPSDVEAGLALGRQVAARALERAASDGSSAPWTGTVPAGPGLWTGENPAFPTSGTWQTWVLASPDQFRPAPPPAYDSEELAGELDELRAVERTPAMSAAAQFWEVGAGGRRIHWFWNDIADRLILTAGLDDDALKAAQAYALVNIAGYDAMVACWDAKYTYWAARPAQLDPTFQPLFAAPGHPSYPSAHSCISTAMASTLASLFPADRAEVMALAEQASESRVWAGIHFRSDLDAGTDIGASVAQAVLASVEGGALN